MLARVAPNRARDTFRVLGPNVTAVRLFQAMRTQWNVTALPAMDRAHLVHIGLRYEVLDLVAADLGIGKRPGDLARIQIMENEALLAWAEARR